MASSARIEELEKKFNENPRRYFAPLANEYRKAGETEQAIALCRAYLPQQPGHMSGHIVFGQALFDAGEIDEAQGVFETALTLDPENLIALRHLGDIAHSRGDIAGARGWYRRVLDADPRNEEIAAQLAALPDDGSASATGSTPSGAAGSVGWGDINPERSQTEAAGDETPSAARASAGAPASADVPAAATPKAEPLEIERASASEDEDIDIDALFTTTDAPAPAPASNSADSADSGGIAALADEETAEVPVFQESRDDEPTLEVEIEPDAPAVEEPPAPREEPAHAAAPSDGLGLEVAEFVPPPATESSERALGFETGHEAVVGGPVDGPPGGTRSSETPAGFVTETMAELYLQQGFIEEALNVYRQLLEQNPGDEALRERVAQLEQGARSSVSMAAVSDEVVEAARKRQSSPNRRSMRQFLGALAARRAPNRVSGEREARGSNRIEEAQPEQLEPIEPEALVEDLPFDAEPQVAELPYEAPEPAPAPDLPFEPAEPEAAMPYEPPRAPMSSRASQEPEPFARTGGAPSGEEGLDALFAGNGIDPDDQAAATTLAGAFDATTMPPAPSGPRGRPTRAAPSELSLDHVFRESGGDAGLQRPRSDFSFDQFFSDEASDASQRSNGDEGPPEPAGEPPSPDDIGQFNAWLEGLKKK